MLLIATGLSRLAHGLLSVLRLCVYHLDLKHIKSYVESAATPEAWDAYKTAYLSGTQADYIDAVGGADTIGAIAKPVY